MKSNKRWIGAGLLSAFAASACCITPVLALIAGTSGLASSFSWIEAYRPYLIGLTVLVLGYAWYKKLKPMSDIGCVCEITEKPKFLQSKTFLVLVTVFAALMLAFPYYSNVFYPQYKQQIISVEESNIKTIEFSIDGMTCFSCEEHVDYEVMKLNGIINSQTSFEKGNAIIDYDKTQTTEIEIEKAINTTGYTVTNK
jgi:copper chaperone CopZ